VPLIYGQAISYSPLFYRARERWSDVRDVLTGAVVQPRAAAAETPERLDAAARAIDDAFRQAAERLAAAELDALVVLVADRGRTFDDTNIPQLHVFAGPSIWGDPALPELDEAPAPVSFRCDAELGSLLAEELARDGFDVSESRAAYVALGDPLRGAVPALIEPLCRLGIGVPIVPIHVNAHVEPCISGRRMAPFGAALTRALKLVPQRVGLLASGGLSGEPGGAMAGWIDDVLDTWVLTRLRYGRSEDMGGIFEVRSQSLRGATREIRLWAAAAAACEAAGLRARDDGYLALHHAAGAAAFMHWERA
jgi:protocatechuate 4,5-dioxygenase beta chain